VTQQPCPVCNETVGTSSELREHTWSTHSACHHCGESFGGGDKEALYRHWLSAHPDELSRIDRNRAEAAVGEITARDLAASGEFAAAVGSIPRRWLLLAGGTVAGGGVLAGLLLGDGTGRDSVEPIADVPLPSTPDAHQYAIMGSTESAPVVTYFGNWKCPYCAQFSTGFFRNLVSEYVRPGKIAIEYRNLTYLGGEPFLGPDAPAAARAGLAVWANEPGAYWAFHDHVFANQPPERRAWATADRLASFAEAAGVSDPGVIRTAIRNRRYESALRDTTRAAQASGVTGTPTLVADGRAVSALDRSSVRSLLDDLTSDG
jgi:protein-disulfide isomerase